MPRFPLCEMEGRAGRRNMGGVPVPRVRAIARSMVEEPSNLFTRIFTVMLSTRLGRHLHPKFFTLLLWERHARFTNVVESLCIFSSSHVEESLTSVLFKIKNAWCLVQPDTFPWGKENSNPKETSSVVFFLSAVLQPGRSNLTRARTYPNFTFCLAIG